MCIQLLTHIPQENFDSPPTQTIEPALGFTLAEICQAQAEPKNHCRVAIRNRIMPGICQNMAADIRWHLCTSTQKVFTSS